jgi:ActR/RegA family two-component response regulator
VEDHSLFAQALELVLGQRLAVEGEGAEFARAATVADGLRIADRHGPFDLAVVDLVLPDGNGADLVREVKAAYPETRVAVLSAVAGPLRGALGGCRRGDKQDGAPAGDSRPPGGAGPRRGSAGHVVAPFGPAPVGHAP